jgi:PAS domain S-box-containing protein
VLIISTIIKTAALLSYVVLALLTIRSNAGRRLRTIFFVYLFGMIYWQFASLMVNLSRTSAQALFWYNIIASGTGLYSVLYYPFARAFVGKKHRTLLTYVAYGCSLAMVLIGVTGIGYTGVRMGRAGIYVPEFGDFVIIPGLVGYLFWALGILVLVREARSATSDFQRNRVMYPLIGAALAAAGSLSNFTPLQDYPIDISANLIHAVLIGYAVIRYRVLDIRAFLTRSLSYSLVTGVLVGLYIGLIFASERLLQHFFGYDSGFSGLLAVFVLALSFLPLRDKLQVRVDRVFFRTRYDYQRVLQSFSRAATSILNPEELQDLILDTIRDSLRVRTAFIMLYDDEQGAYVVARSRGFEPGELEGTELKENDRLAVWLRRQGSPLLKDELSVAPDLGYLSRDRHDVFAEESSCAVIPILVKDRLLGILGLGPRLSGGVYSEEDLRFITTLTNQAGTAIDNAMVYQEIERRLSQQTLLLILSETFRRSTDVDAVSNALLRVLSSFLYTERCGLVYFEWRGTGRTYGSDDVTRALAVALSDIEDELRRHVEGSMRRGARGFVRGGEVVHMLPDLPSAQRSVLREMVLVPLELDEILGLLLIPNRINGRRVGQREAELLQTVRSILSQGFMLQRTIQNLVDVKNYNENILNSMNDMGDTLVIVGLDRKIHSANEALCRLLGYEREELLGASVDLIVPPEENPFVASRMVAMTGERSISNYEMHYVARDGNRIPILFSGSLMRSQDRRAQSVVGIARDITEHKRAEEVRKNLVLIKEIHHRIKNNLQAISSLLYLQSGYVEDRRTKEMFKESQNRVRSMALIHEKLYRSDNAAGVSFSDYVRDLTKSLLRSYGVSTGAVTVTVDTNDITLGMDTAVPCGLIINELVSNSLKHAFPEGPGGEITIAMTRERRDGGAPRFRLTVADSGPGFPEEIDFRRTESLGLRLVCTLTNDLDGSIDLVPAAGTKFEITFPDKAD